jgi:hypothetical protein
MHGYLKGNEIQLTETLFVCNINEKQIVMKTSVIIKTVLALFISINTFASEDLRVEITKTDITCFGQSNGKAELFITGGAEPYAISWSNGNTSQEIQDLKKGKYVVTVLDAEGNSVKDSVQIAMPAPISVGYNVPTSTSAANFNSDLNIAVKGGSPWDLENASSMYIFRLNDKTYYEHPEKLVDGIYKLTVEDARGCKLAFNVNLQVQLDNEKTEQAETPFNGFGNVKMTVHPIHLVIEQQQKTFTNAYN